MSAQTKSAIDDALRAHIADEVGTMVVAWALVVACCWRGQLGLA